MPRERFLRYRHDTDRDTTLTSMSMGANFLYVKMTANDRMNAAGVLPVVPKQFTRLAADLDKDRFWELLAELEATRLVVVDHDTDEAMIRSYVRHSKVMYQPNRVTNLAREVWPAVFSPKIRAHLVVELARVMVDDTEVKTWPVVATHAPDLHTQVREAARKITITGEIPDPYAAQEALELDEQFSLHPVVHPVENPVNRASHPVDKPVDKYPGSPY